MHRRFRRHDLRRTTDLSGVWDFTFLGDRDPDEVQPSALHFDDAMAIPGCFDATPAYAGRRGLAAYRTRVLLGDEAPHRLLLDGVHHWCRVFAAGRPLRDHAGGFTPFGADLVGMGPGEVELVVLVDNRFDEQRSPLHCAYYDWYHYGGIARAAELQRLGPLWIEQVRAVTGDLAARRLELTIAYASVAEPGETRLAVSVGGRTILEEQVTLAAASGELSRTIELPGAPLWSPGEPNLHLLHVRLGEDDVRERIGLRTIRTEGRRLLLNGRPLRLLGFNRHELHPHFGHGLPEAVLVSDVQILRDLGCNFVRNAHYPPDARFLDLCDELGICVWAEPTAWQWTVEHLRAPRLLEAALANLEEMVGVCLNHPSVILYGLLNESASHQPESRPGYEALIARFRARDPSRPVTYASCHPLDDALLDLADVVSVNTYPGWYEGTVDEIPERLARIAASLEARGYGDKPLLLSEAGAGAIPGWRDWHAELWSEDYQAKVLDAILQHVLARRERWCGVALWQFCDVRSSEHRPRALARPRSYNNKGVVDEHRRPKLAYEVVKRHFHAAQRGPRRAQPGP